MAGGSIPVQSNLELFGHHGLETEESQNANCVEKDHTENLNVLFGSSDEEKEENDDDIDSLHPTSTKNHYSSECRDQDCSGYSSSMAYIARFLNFALSKKV